MIVPFYPKILRNEDAMNGCPAGGELEAIS
jgi:hypothetical protein